VKKRILIVDDSEAVRDVMRSLLEDQDDFAICGEAADGFNAIRLAQALQPDLILLDLVMPKLNGAAAVSELKAVVPGVSVILFTMFEDSVDALAPALGVDIVLSKIDSLRNLVQHIRDLLEDRASGVPREQVLSRGVRKQQPVPRA